MSYGSAEENQSFEFYDQPDERPTRDERRQAPVFQSHLLEQLIDATKHVDSPSQGRLQQFLDEPSVSKSLLYWLGNSPGVTREQVVLRLNRDVAFIDELLNEQVNRIIHHESFQRLEASLRGLQFLVNQAARENDTGVKVKVLNASWRDLDRDFERASEFDRSHLFRTVYENEFGSPGGEPFGLLLGDYEVQPRPGPGHPNDIGLLTSISQVAAASFCPFITSASPAMFGLNDFGGLEHRLNHAKTFQQQDYLKWRALRETADSRFLGLTMPRVLMRVPYEDDGTRIDRFRFEEQVAGPDRSRYLWGNACYAFGSILIRTFAESGWLADIRGVERDTETRGLVTGLPVHSFTTDRKGIAPKSSTDVIITDELEKELCDLGFIPLCDCQDTEYSAFYSNQSIQKPAIYDRDAATANSRMSAMLQYMLCVSRFAHYIKVIGRDKVGSFSEADEFERFLHEWMVRFVNADSDASQEVKARFPLREATVSVKPNPGKPGNYQCIMRLCPHYELDEVNASVRVVTELVPPRES